MFNRIEQPGADNVTMDELIGRLESTFKWWSLSTKHDRGRHVGYAVIVNDLNTDKYPRPPKRYHQTARKTIASAVLGVIEKAQDAAEEYRQLHGEGSDAPTGRGIE